MTTELDPERIRMRAFYLSLTRPPPGNPDLDWIEAEAQERASLEDVPRAAEPLPLAEPSAIEEAVPMEILAPVEEPAPIEQPAEPEPEPAPPALTPAIVLERYARLSAEFARAGADRNLETSYLGALLQSVIDGQDDHTLQMAEHALDVLLARFKPAELTRLGSALVDTTDALQSEVSWDLAQSELSVLAALQSKGLLQSLGWRRPAAFQCCLGTKKFGIALDIKPALGGGLRTVHSAVTAAASELGRAQGLGDLDAIVWFRGRAAVKPGAADARSALATFSASVQSQKTRPTSPVPLQLGAALFDVTIGERAADGTSSLATQLLPVFKKYLEARAHEASGDEDAPFLLVNVVLPSASGGGAGEPSHLLEAVAKRAAAGAATLANSVGSLWLGLLELDLRAPEPKTSLLIRPAASWPLSYRELVSSLDATVAVL